MNKLLCEVLNMCHLISMESEADVFFEYLPHCNAYSIYWYQEGWTQETADNMENIECVTGIKIKNLKNTIAKLNAIATELGVL